MMRNDSSYYQRGYLQFRHGRASVVSLCLRFVVSSCRLRKASRISVSISMSTSITISSTVRRPIFDLLAQNTFRLPSILNHDFVVALFRPSSLVIPTLLFIRQRLWVVCHCLAEAVQFSETEAERSATRTVLVDDDTAAWRESVTSMNSARDACGIPACFPPKPFVHWRPMLILMSWVKLMVGLRRRWIGSCAKKMYGLVLPLTYSLCSLPRALYTAGLGAVAVRA